MKWFNPIPIQTMDNQLLLESQGGNNNNLKVKETQLPTIRMKSEICETQNCGIQTDSFLYTGLRENGLAEDANGASDTPIKVSS